MIIIKERLGEEAFSKFEKVRKGLQSIYRRKFNDCRNNGMYEITFYHHLWGSSDDLLFIGLSSDNGLFMSHLHSSGAKYRAEANAFVVSFGDRVFNYHVDHFDGRTYYISDYKGIAGAKKIFDLFLKEIKNIDSDKHIPKSTKIEHKTFKGRKRRSVAEAIIERGFVDDGR